MSEMKFEPGRTYKTRSGDDALIYCVDAPGEWCIRGRVSGHQFCWKSDGRTPTFPWSNAPSDFDLLPPAPWNNPDAAEDLAASTLRSICDYVKMGGNELLRLPSEQWDKLRKLVNLHDAAVGAKSESAPAPCVAICRPVWVNAWPEGVDVYSSEWQAKNAAKPDFQPLRVAVPCRLEEVVE